MKRINLFVDLDDNEIFEQEVKEAIRGKVRNIVRQEAEHLVKSETDKEVARLFETSNWTYTSTVKSLVRGCVSDAITREVNSSEFKAIIAKVLEEKCGAIADKTVEKFGENIRSRVHAAISIFMTKEVNERIRNMLGND